MTLNTILKKSRGFTVMDDLEKIVKKLNISLIIFFGSQVTKKFSRKSDFDIAVFSRKPLALKERDQLLGVLSEKFNINEDQIDLVEISSASPLLQFQISSQGKLLWGNSLDFIRFKVLAWKRYLDTAKLRRAREKYLRKRIYAK